MQSADTVDCSAATHRQIRHVERFEVIVRILAAQRQQIPQADIQRIGRIARQILLHQRGCEPIETGGYCGMRGEHVARARRDQRRIEWHAIVEHEHARAVQYGQRGMPFIQMAHIGAQIQGIEQAPAADAEHDLLLQPKLGAAAIELAGDATACGVIRNVIAVEQVQLQAADPDLPGAQPEPVAGHADLQAQPFALRRAHRSDRQLARIVVRVEGLLRALLIDQLAEVALLVEQSHPDHRHPEIARRLELIARDVAQAAGIDWQRLAQHEFHAEVCDPLHGAIRMCLLEPGRGMRDLVRLRGKPRQGRVECRVGQHLRQSFGRSGAEHHPGIVRALPQLRLELFPELVGGVAPRPAQIQGQPAQHFDVRLAAHRCGVKPRDSI